MELLLLGTAAAEGWPAPFCICPNCEEARRRGGANLRSRSGALLDGVFKVDYNADTVGHMQRSGRSLAKLETLVFTHQHSDHIMPLELWWMKPPFTQTPTAQPITVYGNAQVLAMIRAQLGEMDLEKFVNLRGFEAFKAVTTPVGDKILPLPAEHVEGALLLRITRGGKTLLYGHDSGLFPEETIAALAAGPALDIALLDCTNGGLKTSNRGHMGVDGVIQMTDALRRRGVITPATRVVATHFSHNGGLLHEELVRTFLPHQIEVAFDGMTLRV